MHMNQLGHLSVGAVGLGCNNFGTRLDAEATAAVVDAALESGINLFDTADVYGDGLSEEYLGKALRGRRGEAVIATKFGMTMPNGEGASPTWLKTAITDSLHRLSVDHIDLYQLHRPDPDVPVAETLGALQGLVDKGVVGAIGVSNVDVAQLEEGLAASAAGGTASWSTVQNEYSLLRREPEADGVLSKCTEEGLGFLPFFPLASGVLTGKYRPDAAPPEGTRLATIPVERSSRFLNEDSLSAAMRLEAFAMDHGYTLLDLAFSYLLAHPAVTSVIAGATSPQQLTANAAAASWELTPNQTDEVRQLLA